MGKYTFEKKEKEILENLLQEKENCVLSVGGGTPTFYDNMTSITANSTCFFLRTSVSTLVDRLRKNKDRRPILARIADEDLAEFVAKHLFERNAYYRNAQFTIDTSYKSPDEIVEEIILKVHGY